MVRLWLALVMVGVLGGDSLAARAVVKGTCGQDGVSLPRSGATDVPTNARVWRLYRDTAPWSRALDVPPHTTYELPSYYVSFTTGDGPDLEPPAQPRIGNLSITVAGNSPLGRMSVANMYISGEFSKDTALLRLRMFDAGRVLDYYMPASEYAVDEPGFALHIGAVRGELTAIDLAGNESSPAPFMALPTLDRSFASSCSHSEIDYSSYSSSRRERSDLMGSPAVSVPVLLDFMIGLLLVIVAGRRSDLRAKAVLEPLAITAAEQLARRIRLRSALIAVVMIVTVAGTAPLDTRLAIALGFASPVLLWVFGAALVSWWAASRVLRLATRDGAVATLCHDEVAAIVGERRVKLRCSPRLIARARVDALPKATSL